MAATNTPVTTTVFTLVFAPVKSRLARTIDFIRRRISWRYRGMRRGSTLR